MTLSLSSLPFVSDSASQRAARAVTTKQLHSVSVDLVRPKPCPIASVRAAASADQLRYYLVDPWVLIVSLSTRIAVVGQHISIQVVFSIPEKARNIIFNSRVAISQHLVYVEWYTPFSNPSNHNHLLYKVSPLQDEVGGHLYSVIPLASIQHSVYLFLRLGPSAPQKWTSSNALNLCSSFYVNTFTDSHLYRTLI